MFSIYQELKRCHQDGVRGVLGTIISTEGSSYQKVGAKCFISEDGIITGLVSGGCVESDLKEHAASVLQTGRGTIVHYNFQDENDLIWGLGLGCNGKITILLEPFLPVQQPETTESLVAAFSLMQSHSLCIVKVIDAKSSSFISEQWLINLDHIDTSIIPYQDVVVDLHRQLCHRQSVLSTVRGGNDVRIFYDFTTPPPHLVIFGAGPDAIPLVQIAQSLKWNVELVDHRLSHLEQEVFSSVVKKTHYAAGRFPTVEITTNSYVIVMTHNFLQDQVILQEIINMNVAYIGLLGPRKRMKELLKTDIYSDKQQLIHSPVGLDIGSKTPEEIALSILAEIMLVYRGGTGRKLSEVKKESESLLSL
ncbi:XdhC family protein [Halalkalibacter kiskunsagensis]|uniref:XdhC family protein n=1 Tax=Halalkalibacter kiskunsagensis TaxID=1548599 RepID=A0ABV6KD45_9BACI